MSSDRLIQQAVLDELRWEPRVPAEQIGVTAHDGVVTLSGHVASFAERHAAEAAAKRVKGVLAVVEKIEIRLAETAKRDDAAIAEAAAQRLAWDVLVPPGAVTVVVTDGWVTLEGEVDWHYQREAAELDVRGLYGVVGLSNAIRIRSGVDTVALSDDIAHALHRSWFFDPKTINVSAVAGAVTLSGTVRSPHERQLAASTAWAAPGVTDVINELIIV